MKIAEKLIGMVAEYKELYTSHITKGVREGDCVMVSETECVYMYDKDYIWVKVAEPKDSGVYQTGGDWSFKEAVKRL